jgi:Uma2 family endonuclease
MNTVVSAPIHENIRDPFFFDPTGHYNQKDYFDQKKYVERIWLPVSTQTEISSNDKSIYDGMIVSEEDYWSKYYEMPDVSLEWNNGRLEEKPMPDRDSFEVYTWLWRLLTEYFDTFSEGMLMGLETGFKLTFDNHTSIRKPDLAFIHKDNPNQMAPFDKTYYGCFDICFEFLSDSDKAAVERDTIVKKHEYEKFGVKEYYILDRLGDETAFYALDSKGSYQPLKPDRRGVIHSTVLNNFQFIEEDLYNRPSMLSLTNNSVYSHYVMVEYQKEREARKKYQKKNELATKAAESAKLEAKNAKIEAKNAETKAKNAETKAKNAETKAKNAKIEAKNAKTEAKNAKRLLEIEKSRANEAESRYLSLEKEIANLKRHLNNEV